MASVALRLAANTSRAARAAPAWRQCTRMQARWLHERKELPYAIENGLGDFLPPESLRMIAVDYQQGLLDRLNEHVQGTALEGKSVVQTLLEAARDPMKVLPFNYASEALNNSFFLGNLKPPAPGTTDHEDHLTRSRLLAGINESFQSLDHLKSSFSAAVTGMFSSGWLWLVCDQNGKLAIYPTFGCGTLLVRSKKEMGNVYVIGEGTSDPVVEAAKRRAAARAARMASAESAPSSSPASGMMHLQTPLDPPAGSRAFSTWSVRREGYNSTPNLYEADAADSEDQPDDTPKNLGDVLYPLFCVSVHEHAWVGAGYGVWGKDEYMKRFWTVLDWEKVTKAYKTYIPASY